MIPIQLWRARIGLFNAKRHSGPRSPFFPGSSSGSSSLTLALLHEKSSIPPTAHSPIRDSPPGSSTDKHVPSTDHDHEHKYAFSTETDSSSSTVSISRDMHKQSAVYTNSKISAQLGSKTVHSLLSSMTEGLYLPNDLLKDSLVMLLIVIISQLLVLSGDVETNPGPIASDKPTMNQLISLKKTDGSGEYLRIIRWIASLSHSECMDFAHLLLVDPVKVRTHQKLSNSDEFVRAVLEDWLSRGDGSRAVPRTWTALADCMEAAGLPGDLVKAVRDTFSSGTYTPMEGVEEVDMPLTKKRKSDSYIMEHGPIQVLVEPDIPKELLSLMKEYAGMLVVLEETELCTKEMRQLKSFLSGYCNETAFENCSSPKKVVDMLKVKLKIYIFNIDTLTACCEYFRSQHVSQSVQQYKEHLHTFLSTKSVKDLQSSLQTKVISFDNVDVITLKLNETVSNDTLENLNKLVHHFFGNSSEALILHKIRPGCICVTWIVPSLLVPTLKAKATKLSIEYLASNGVLELVIADLRIAPNEAPPAPPTFITPPSPPTITRRPTFITPPHRHSRRSVRLRFVAFITSCAGSRRYTRSRFRQHRSHMSTIQPPQRQTSIGRKSSNASVSSQTVLMESRAGLVSTRSGSFSTPGTPIKPDYTGVFAVTGYYHIKVKMLNKYKDQVHDLKDKGELISALLDPHCLEIIAFTGYNFYWEEVFREIDSRAFPIPDSPKITRVIFSDSDPAEGHCVETGRMKFVYFVGKPDEPDILEKLMMKGDIPVLKKDSHQRYPSSDATLLTQDSRNEPDYPSPIDEEERTPRAPKASCSTHSESPTVTHVVSEFNLSGSANSTPSPVKQDRHPTAATSMQLATAPHKNVEQLQTPATGLQSTSAPLISTRVEDLLAETIELHKKELILMESIYQHTQKSANKAEEQVELMTEQIASLTLDPPLP